MKIAIIPARGNSQRIKNKNIKNFNGSPILKVTSDIIKSFKIFDKIVLTTDNQKIFRLSSNYKFDLLIKRPKRLGNDKIGTNQVINHAIKVLKKKFDIKIVCCIYPCAPLIEKKTIIKSFNMIGKYNDFVFPVLPYLEPIEQAMTINKDDNIKYVFPKNSKKNTNEFEKKFYDAGQFYTSSVKGWNLKKKNYKGIKLKKYITADIDDIEDWNFVKDLYKKKYI